MIGIMSAARSTVAAVAAGARRRRGSGRASGCGPSGSSGWRRSGSRGGRERAARAGGRNAAAEASHRLGIRPGGLRQRLVEGCCLRAQLGIGLGHPRAAEPGGDETLRDFPEQLADEAAAHRVAVDVRLVDLQVVHQLDHIVCPSRAAGLGLVALPVIAVVDRDDAVGLGNLWCDPGREPHASGRVRVTMDEDDPRAAFAKREVVNLDAVGGGEKPVLRVFAFLGSGTGCRQRKEDNRSDQSLHAWHIHSPERIVAPGEPFTGCRPRPGGGQVMSGAAVEAKRPASWPARPTADHGATTIAAREVRAAALGTALADTIADPTEFARQLAAAFHELADPEYRAGQAFVAPGIGPTHGVRTPLQVAVRKAFERASRRASPSELLVVADRLLREPEREARWFAITTLQRTLDREAERTWQLLRRAASEADDWITVDTLAHPYGKGILAEPYRWAELEQLTVSPSRWERRLVGSTIATMPSVNRRLGREPGVAAHALPLLATLIGDHEPDVQKSLSWAYRSMTVVDLSGTTVALGHEADIAAERDDGHRAWVVRDSLSKLEPTAAERIRRQLAGIRRRAGAPSTSVAAELAARFADMGLGRPMPEPPLT